jgi:AmpD protein
MPDRPAYFHAMKQPCTIQDGWLTGAQRSDSPNCDERPAGVPVDLLVVHGISLPPGEFGGPWIAQLFGNSLPADAHPYFADICHLRVSAHLLIRRDGSMIQFVPFDRRAWHAGVSEYRGRGACNDFSVGIELEGTDELPYESIQYERLAAVARCLIAHYPGLDSQRIVGHSDIAPGRKTDPGPFFDWALFRQ